MILKILLFYHLCVALSQLQLTGVHCVALAWNALPNNFHYLQNYSIMISEIVTFPKTLSSQFKVKSWYTEIQWFPFSFMIKSHQNPRRLFKCLCGIHPSVGQCEESGQRDWPWYLQKVPNKGQRSNNNQIYFITQGLECN